MYETDFAVSILSCVFILPFLLSRWWPIGLKHVIELILNKEIVVFHQICCDSCYLKQSWDESSFKKNLVYLLIWNRTCCLVHSVPGVVYSSCIVKYAGGFFPVAPKLLSSCHHTSCESCCWNQWSDTWDAVWKPVSQQPVSTSSRPPGTLRLHRNYRSFKHRGTVVSSILFIIILTCFGPFEPSSGVTYKFY